MSTLRVADFIGRMLMALLFILAAVGKATNSGPALAHMAAHGVPAFVLPAVIALELAAGLALLAGWRVHWAAAALAVFCLAAAFVFHLDLGNPPERTLFFKDLALAGGLIVMALSAAHAKGLMKA